MLTRAHRRIRSLLREGGELRRRRLHLLPPTPAPRNAPEHHSLVAGADLHEEFGRIEFPIKFAYRNLKFIHVGKSGGSTIRWELLSAGIQLEEYHVRKPIWRPEYWYFIWIRNPLHRFVSAFNFSKEIIAFDLSSCDGEKLTMNNCPAPHYIQHRFDHGYAFEPSYDGLLSSFSSPNALAESLTSNNRKLRQSAHALMRHRQGHIYKGLGWYLDNGAFVRNFRNQLLFVGRLEHFNEDLARLADKVALPLANSSRPTHKRKGNTQLPRDLSTKGLDNVRKFYEPYDYAALRALLKHGFISQEHFEQYREF